jgi:prepilin-type N-terminal cleavage/methylation domain-containing protein
MPYTMLMDKGRARRYFNRGFTLIELLVVIAIIGLLASIVLTSLTAARAKGRDAQRVQEMQEMQKALELYNNANGRYPIAAVACNAGATVWVSFDSPIYSPNTLCQSDGATSDGNTLTQEMAPYVAAFSDPLGAASDSGYLYEGNGANYCFMSFRKPENLNNFLSTIVNHNRCPGGINSSGQCLAAGGAPNNQNSIFITSGGNPAWLNGC